MILPAKHMDLTLEIGIHQPRTTVEFLAVIVTKWKIALCNDQESHDKPSTVMALYHPLPVIYDVVNTL